MCYNKKTCFLLDLTLTDVLTSIHPIRIGTEAKMGELGFSLVLFVGGVVGDSFVTVVSFVSGIGVCGVLGVFGVLIVVITGG